MRDALTKLAGLLGETSADAVAWHRLGYQQTSALQAKLIGSGMKPDYVKKHVAALRGVIAGHSNPQITVASYDTRGVEDFTAAVDRLRNPEGAA